MAKIAKEGSESSQRDGERSLLPPICYPRPLARESERGYSAREPGALTHLRGRGTKPRRRRRRRRRRLPAARSVGV